MLPVNSIAGLFLQDYVQSSFESEPVTIVAMDLGVKESTFSPKTVRKSYKPYFVWGQLINWYKQSVADPGATLNNVSGAVSWNTGHEAFLVLSPEV